MILLSTVTSLLFLQALYFTRVSSSIVPIQKTSFLRKPRDLGDFRNQTTPIVKGLLPPSVYRCGETSRDLVLNFVNPNFPDNDMSPGDCRFRLIISSPHVCQVRVDFVDTEMVAPTRGDCLTQLFEVEGAMWSTGLPPLCGVNNDQHFYLHLDTWSANTSYLDFRLVTAVSGKPYRFGMWLTQIECTNFNVLRAPDGCTQYFLGESGSIKSFNLEGAQHLNGQNYRICIRTGKGVCGIRYESNDGDFNIRKSIVAAEDVHKRSGTGSSVCGLDYLLIPNGRVSLAHKRSEKRGRLLWRRPGNIIIVTDMFRQEPPPPPVHPVIPVYQPPEPHRDPARMEVTTTTETTTVKSTPKMTPRLKGHSDRYCGGVLSTTEEETSNQPVFARITSNLITLRVKTSTLMERKVFKRNEFPNMSTGFRIHYRQLRQCGEDLPDLASQPNIMHLIQSSNPTIIINSEKFSMPFGNTTKAGPESEFIDDFESELPNWSEDEDEEAESSELPNKSTKNATSDDISWDYLEVGESHESSEPSTDHEEDYDLYDF